MSERVALIGAGDLGRTLAHHVAACSDKHAALFFDDLHHGEEVAGLPVLAGLDGVVSAYRQGRFDSAVMAIGYRHLRARARLFAELRAAGIPFPPLVHPSCYVDRGARLGDGVVLFPGCVIDVGVDIGDNTLLNLGCRVAHDSRIGAHAFLAPSVSVAGFAVVGAYAFLGIGTVIVDNITLGEGCQTGGGAVVIRDLEPRVLAAGVPARVLRRLPLAAELAVEPPSRNPSRDQPGSSLALAAEKDAEL